MEDGSDRLRRLHHTPHCTRRSPDTADTGAAGARDPHVPIRQNNSGFWPEFRRLGKAEIGIRTCWDNHPFPACRSTGGRRDWGSSPAICQMSRYAHHRRRSADPLGTQVHVSWVPIRGGGWMARSVSSYSRGCCRGCDPFGHATHRTFPLLGSPAQPAT